ncbi:leucine-rich_repeat domain-containing protein [Hexamita inflata]|uniref:Leucine-rich repeat domain-containing protein n=1 Tax=Hexamita inflata TaxID=28002 RepID=A0AA86PAD9_9EUKA|nr:leucine-rich repeat domain-containing protein [Hexamita inflata]
MTLKYKDKIVGGNLDIGDWNSGDPDLTSLDFLQKFNISTLTLGKNANIQLKLSSQTITTLKVMYIFNINLDDLELDNLEDLTLINNKLVTTQTQSLSKFKSLKALNISINFIDITHIRNLSGLTKLHMELCDLKTIESIGSLVNLQDLNLSRNKEIDISPLSELVNLRTLDINDCGLKSLCAIRQLINLKGLVLSYNPISDVTILQYLVNITSLELMGCGLVSVFALRELDLERLDISYNRIVYLENLDLHNKRNLVDFQFEQNFIPNFDLVLTHKNYEQFNIFSFDQKEVEINAIYLAEWLRYVENANIAVKQISFKRKTLKQTVFNAKRKINAFLNQIQQNQIQFTTKIVQNIQRMNEQDSFQ